MPKKRFEIGEPKPIEEWTVKEWETAYGTLTRKYDLLRETLRKALQTLNAAV